MNMTTATLAHRVGVTVQTINNFFGGRTQPRIDLCYEIIEELGETPDKLSFYFPPKGIRIETAVQPKNVRGVIRIGSRAS